MKQLTYSKWRRSPRRKACKPDTHVELCCPLTIENYFYIITVAKEVHKWQKKYTQNVWVKEKNLNTKRHKTNTTRQQLEANKWKKNLYDFSEHVTLESLESVIKKPGFWFSLKTNKLLIDLRLLLKEFPNCGPWKYTKLEDLERRT